MPRLMDQRIWHEVCDHLEWDADHRGKHRAALNLNESQGRPSRCVY